MKRIAILLTACTALLAFSLGAGLSSIQSRAVAWAERSFAVEHRVEYTHPQTGQALVAERAALRLDGGEVLFSDGGQALRLPLESVVLTCLDRAARTQNVLRAAALTALVALLGAAVALAPLVVLARLRRLALLRRRQQTARRAAAQALPIPAPLRRTRPAAPSAA